MEFFFVFYSLRLHGHTSTEEVHPGAWTAAGARFRPIGERGSIRANQMPEREKMVTIRTAGATKFQNGRLGGLAWRNDHDVIDIPSKKAV